MTKIILFSFVMVSTAMGAWRPPPAEAHFYTFHAPTSRLPPEHTATMEAIRATISGEKPAPVPIKEAAGDVNKSRVRDEAPKEVTKAVTDFAERSLTADPARQQTVQSFLRELDKTLKELHEKQPDIFKDEN